MGLNFTLTFIPLLISNSDSESFILSMRHCQQSDAESDPRENVLHDSPNLKFLKYSFASPHFRFINYSFPSPRFSLFTTLFLVQTFEVY